MFGLSDFNRKERERNSLPITFLKNEKPLMATLMEEMKQVVAVKDDFAFRDKSKVIAFFGFSDNHSIYARKKTMISFVNRVLQ